MKTLSKIMLLLLFIVGVTPNVSAQLWGGHYGNESTKASITIKNHSDYSLTVKIMRTGGRGVYCTLNISPNSSSSVSFMSSDSYYTKTKATKGGLFPETLYRKSDAFYVQCDNSGYTQGTLEFYVSSGGGGSSGRGISKSEFESNTY